MIQYFIAGAQSSTDTRRLGVVKTSYTLWECEWESSWSPVDFRWRGYSEENQPHGHISQHALTVGLKQNV